MRGKRKPPTSTRQSEPTMITHDVTQPAAQCEDCGHTWFLRRPRIGRCPGCLRLGSAHKVTLIVSEKAA
jgi:hypothetical protein